MLRRRNLIEIPHGFDDGLGHNAVFFIISLLDLTAARCLVHRVPHRLGDLVGVEDDAPARVARRTADGLNQARLRPEEALLVRVQNCDQRHLRQVKSLAQQVDPDKHVKFRRPQIADDLNALHRANVGMHIAHLDPVFLQIPRQVLGHLLRQRRDERPLALRRRRVDLADEIVDLPLDWADEDLRVEQPCGPDDLFGNLACAFALIVCGRGRDVDSLANPAVELVERQRPVVVGRRQTEAKVDQRLFPCPVAIVHRPHLRKRHMALVDEQQKILWEIVQQGHRRAARRTLRDDARIVLDTGAIAQLLHHFDVIVHALADALRLEQLAVVGEEFHALVALLADLADRARHLLLRRDIVARGPDRNGDEPPDDLAGDGVDLADAVDLVAEVFHADRARRPVGGPKLNRVASDAEHIALKRNVVALIPVVNEAAHQLLARKLRPGRQIDHHLLKIIRLAESVDAADRRHDDHVPPLQQRGRRGQPQPVDLLVDGGVLFNIGIRMGDIRLGLIIVVVGHEIFHRVVREKRPELRTELRSQRLVVCQHERRTVAVRDDVRHRKRLARAGHTEQHLLRQTVFDAPRQFFNGLRLVAGGLIIRNKLKIHVFTPKCRRRPARRSRRPRR